MQSFIIMLLMIIALEGCSSKNGGHRDTNRPIDPTPPMIEVVQPLPIEPVLTFKEKCEMAGDVYVSPSNEGRCYNVKGDLPGWWGPLDWDSQQLSSSSLDIRVIDEKRHGTRVLRILGIVLGTDKYTHFTKVQRVTTGNIKRFLRSAPETSIVSISASIGDILVAIRSEYNSVVINTLPNKKGAVACVEADREKCKQIGEANKAVWIRGHINLDPNIESGSCEFVEKSCFTLSFCMNFTVKSGLSIKSGRDCGNSFAAPTFAAFLGTLMVLGNFSNTDALTYAKKNCVQDKGDPAIWGLGILTGYCIQKIISNLTDPITRTAITGSMSLPVGMSAEMDVINGLGVIMKIPAPIHNAFYSSPVMKSSNQILFLYEEGFGVNLPLWGFDLLAAYGISDYFFGGRGTGSFSFGQVNNLGVGINKRGSIGWMNWSLTGQFNRSTAEGGELVENLEGSSVLGEIVLYTGDVNKGGEFSLKTSVGSFLGGEISLQGRKIHMDRGEITTSVMARYIIRINF